MYSDCWEKFYIGEVEYDQDHRSELPRLSNRIGRRRILHVRNLNQQIGMIPWYSSGFT